ncbi:unnamed protein product [Parnassius apollo]|uniref:(apollo) hypothetical protein n=1 Tax=Parnassius apollo TaxID=110799 RepID=A0A8S3XV28_PARAO|nr:unnamed protein product [Parnassius apollo]
MRGQKVVSTAAVSRTGDVFLRAADSHRSHAPARAKLVNLLLRNSETTVGFQFYVDRFQSCLSLLISARLDWKIHRSGRYRNETAASSGHIPRLNSCMRRVNKLQRRGCGAPSATHVVQTRAAGCRAQINRPAALRGTPGALTYTGLHGDAVAALAPRRERSTDTRTSAPRNEQYKCAVCCTAALSRRFKIVPCASRCLSTPTFISLAVAGKKKLFSGSDKSLDRTKPWRDGVGVKGQDFSHLAERAGSWACLDSSLDLGERDAAPM